MVVQWCIGAVVLWSCGVVMVQFFVYWVNISVNFCRKFSWGLLCGLCDVVVKMCFDMLAVVDR